MIRSRITRCAALTLVLLGSAGCWSFDRAKGPRTPSTYVQSDGGGWAPNLSVVRALRPEDWPLRDPEAVRPYFEATPDVVASFEPLDGVSETDLSPQEKDLINSTTTRVVYKGIHARSLLRIVADLETGSEGESESENGRSDRGRDSGWAMLLRLMSPGFDPNAYLFSSRTISGSARAAERLAKTEIGDDGSSVPVQSSLNAPAPKIRSVDVAEKVSLRSGKPLRIPKPLPEGRKPRGVLIHLQSTGYNEFEPQVLEVFRRRGWAVIDMATETDIVTPISDAEAEEARAIRREAAAVWKEISESSVRKQPTDPADTIRATSSHPKYRKYRELTTRWIEKGRGSFQICDETQAEAVGRELAKEIDDAIAGSAFAVEAVLDYIDQARPDLQDVPVVIVGFSAGALVTPAAVVRVRERISAAVMIGGGANLLMISQLSEFKDGGVRLRCGEKKIPKPLLARVSETYLDHAKLDPFHTAPFLEGMPVLQVHATYDDWVPASSGDLLYERLGRPDRLSISAGHELLFYFLPSQANRLADWLDKAVPAAAQGTDAERASSR